MRGVDLKLIFDIGYNKGKFSKVCLEKYPGCKIVGVEANMKLHYNFKKNKNISLLHYAVSDRDNQYVDFFVDYSQDGVSTVSKDFMKNSRFCKGSKYLKEKSVNWNNMGKVKTITLDTMIKKYGIPDVIKIDVEGYEYNVLLGLTQKVGKICFECHEEELDKLENIVKHLSSLGYRDFGLIGYYEEGNVFEKLTFSKEGDPYMVEPEHYFPWEHIKDDIKKCFVKERRVNYGMVWVK